MNRISIKYSYKYYVSFAPEYKFTTCGKCVNVKTNNVIRHVVKRYTEGFNIRGRFISDDKLRPNLAKEQKEKLPF